MKKIALIVSNLCVVAAAAMYIIGSNSGHLSELKDFFWAPLPLAVFTGILSFKADS